jgi:hypothetical protein
VVLWEFESRRACTVGISLDYLRANSYSAPLRLENSPAEELVQMVMKVTIYQGSNVEPMLENRKIFCI